ncbi:flocculation protein FLO11 [Biomphalaria glabrata]|nr:flocculation protein FLO11 [Biomphalaria glabrata]
MEIPEIHVADENNVLTRYTDPIDLCNACRAFYQSRLEMTKTVKAQWRCPVVGGGDGHQGKESKKHSSKKSSLDIAIQLLKHEMACLMEQDLYLMKQMLTLNEEIEDLKWRRRHAWGTSSSSFYSSDMMQSNLSLGKGEEQAPFKFSPPSSLSLQLEGASTRFSLYNDDDPYGTFNRKHLLQGRYGTNRRSIGRTPFVLSSVPLSQHSNSLPESDNTTKQSSPSEQESRLSSLTGSLERVHVDVMSEETEADNGDHVVLSVSRDPSNAVDRELDYRDSDSLRSDVAPKEKSNFTRKNGKLQQVAMDSQDSGIHDCNSGSL